MDPLSITVAATSIVKSCYSVTATIYTFVDDSKNVDSTVDDLLREIQGLSRGAEAIGAAWMQNPKIVTAQTGKDGNLWGSVEASLEDCQLTLAKLNSKMDELKKGSAFGRRFLRKPTKLVMLNMRIKEITAFKDQIQSYNNAMQSALLMINVCLMLNSNSSQESMSHVLVGLKTQIGRVETALHGQIHSGNTAPELAPDSDRMTRNLRTLIREAESLHSSASTIVGGARSTVWGGSVFGDPLSAEKYSSIQNWIQPPTIEEESIDAKKRSGSAFLHSTLGDEQNSDPESDADSDIERHLVKRYRDIALSSLEQKDYPRAESFYRKVIEMSSDSDVPADEVQDLNIMLAFSCGLQGRWEESEATFPPIAFARGISDIRPFHGLYALSMVHINNSDYDTAVKYCKRAIGGYRRLLGKSDPQYFEAMHVLALIYESKGDPVSAEGCRTFLPVEAVDPVAINPQKFLEIVISNDPNTKEAQNRLRSTTPIPPPSGPSGESLSQSHLESEANASSMNIESSSGTMNTSVEAISQRLNEQRLEPRLPSSHQLVTMEKVDEASTAKYPYDTLAYQHQLSAAHRPNTQQYANPVLRSKPSPQLMQPARLIVAVDFGTTHTSVAWAFVDAKGTRQEMIDSWPGAPNVTKPNIPTVIYYDGHGNVVGWGPDIANALAPTGYPKPGVVRVDWFKLQLMLAGNTYIDSLSLTPLPPGKSEIDVSADFLFQVRMAMRSQLLMALGEAFSREEENITYYFTMPVIWNDAGQKALRAAIIKAGYLRDESDNRVNFVTEAEAAAHYCLRSLNIDMHVKDIILIVECGTATVDLQACELAGERPHFFAEFTSGIGDSCGSTSLNRNFSKIIRLKVSKMNLPSNSKIGGRVYAKCIMDFENRIKNDFRNDGKRWAVDVGIESDYPEASIDEGYMIFTNEEILECFEPVVNRIIELVQNQVATIQAQNGMLQHVLVTGPFSISEYLFRHIQLSFNPHFQSRVIRPVNIRGVLATGALVAGIDESKFSRTAAVPGPTGS